MRFMATCTHNDNRHSWPPFGRAQRIEYFKFCNKFKPIIGDCYTKVENIKSATLPEDFAFP